MNNSSLDWLDYQPCRDVGIRFHPTRGAMSVGKSQGGKAPDSLCQAEGVIVADMERLIQEFHDASRWLSSLCTHEVCTCETSSVAALLVKG